MSCCLPFSISMRILVFNWLTVLALSGLFLGGCQSRPSNSERADSSVSEVVEGPSGDLVEVCCGGQASSPEAESDSNFPSHDFGTIEQGDVVEKNFVVANTTGEVVRFEGLPEVSVPCCMEVTVTPEVISVDGEATVRVVFDSRMKPGPFDLFVRLFPSRANFPSTYHLGGTVRPAFEVSTSELLFSEAGSLSFEIGGEDLNKTYRIKEVKTNTPHVTVKESENGEYLATWDGQPFDTGKSAPVIYIITDSEKLGWYPILLGIEEK